MDAPASQNYCEISGSDSHDLGSLKMSLVSVCHQPGMLLTGVGDFGNLVAIEAVPGITSQPTKTKAIA